MKLVGHRGARNEKPENTMEGFKYVYDLGLSAIELDIHKSRDGELVIIHDKTLDRTTSETGAVLEKDLSELERLNVPSLREFFQWWRDKDIEVFLEIKAPGCERGIVDLIEEFEVQDKSVVISFNHKWLKEVKRLNPSLKTGCLMVSLPVDPCVIVDSAGADGASILAEAIDQEFVEQCHKRGYFVKIWNVNDREFFDRVKGLGVDYLCTDNPKQILPLLTK